MNLIKRPIYPQKFPFNSNYPLDHPIMGILPHPMQYRAIGIVEGKYQPLENTLTKGVIIISDNQIFDSVLLGKTISAVKNHIDLNQVQNWVVYPHRIPETNQLHFQITGVYFPQNIDDVLPKNYFSIRGEVIYYSKKEQKVIVKICKNKTLSNKRVEFFKLELEGKIPDNSLKHFYSFSATVEDTKIIIKHYIDLGLIAVNF